MIFIRPQVTAIGLGVFALVYLGPVGLGIWAVISHGNSVVDMIGVTLVGLVPFAVIAIASWRRAFALVGAVGVKSGRFRRPLTPWDQVAGFDVRGASVSVLTTSQERRQLFFVPSFPLLGDSWRNVDAAIKRVLAELETERARFR